MAHSAPMPTMAQAGPMPIRVVLFDCDGTVINNSEFVTKSVFAQQVVELLEQAGKHDIAKKLDRAEFVRQTSGAPMLKIMESLSKEFGITFPENFLEDHEARCDVVLLKQAMISEHTPETIAELRRHKIGSALVTGSSLPRVAVYKKATELGLHFNWGRVFSSETPGAGLKQKPAPDVYLYALKKLGIKPEHALAIEDSASGVRAARAAGIRVWGYVGAKHYTAKDRADISRNLTNLGCERIITNMQDIPTLLGLKTNRNLIKRRRMSPVFSNR